MATSKITKFDAKKPFQGTTSAFVTFEDDSWGFYEYKGEAPFKEGDMVDYTATEEKTKGGKKIFKLIIQGISQTPLQEKKELIIPDLKKVEKSKSITDMKYEGRIYCLKLAVKCLLAGKFEQKDVKETFAEWTGMLDASIDEIQG